MWVLSSNHLAIKEVTNISYRDCELSLLCPFSFLWLYPIIGLFRHSKPYLLNRILFGSFCIFWISLSLSRCSLLEANFTRLASWGPFKSPSFNSLGWPSTTHQEQVGLGYRGEKLNISFSFFCLRWATFVYSKQLI